MKPFSGNDLTLALNEWMRRYVEEPERFQAEMRTVALFKAEEDAGRRPSYGDTSAAYLDQIRGDLAALNLPPAPTLAPSPSRKRRAS